MPTSLALHPRHRLDLRWSHLLHGLVALGGRRDEGTVLTRAGVPEDGLVAASVRSGWLLLLEAAAWPPGAEVLVSALTHPEMAALVSAAGLTPVPVDVDLAALLPPVSALDAALTPRTRAVLVAQLFGPAPTSTSWQGGARRGTCCWWRTRRRRTRDRGRWARPPT